MLITSSVSCLWVFGRACRSLEFACHLIAHCFFERSPRALRNASGSCRSLCKARDFAACRTISSCSAAFRTWYTPSSASVMGLRAEYDALLKVGPSCGRRVMIVPRAIQLRTYMIVRNADGRARRRINSAPRNSGPARGGTGTRHPRIQRVTRDIIQLRKSAIRPLRHSGEQPAVPTAPLRQNQSRPRQGACPRLSNKKNRKAFSVFHNP